MDPSRGHNPYSCSSWEWNKYEINNFLQSNNVSEQADLLDYSFPCMSYTNQELCQFSEIIFKEQKVLETFNIGADKLSKIVEKICLDYNVPAYHNFAHGFNVFQVRKTLL